MPVMTAERCRAKRVLMTCGPGYIYLTKWRTSRSYKIGLTINIKSRLANLGHILVHKIRVPNMRRAEKVAHAMFHHRRHGWGEYFDLTPREVAQFKKLTGRQLDRIFEKEWLPDYGSSLRYARESLESAIQRFAACKTADDVTAVLRWARSGGKWFLLSQAELERLNEAYRTAADLCQQGVAK